MEITVREARQQDASAIAAILRALGWFEHINDESQAQAERHIAEQLAQCDGDTCHMVLVAEYNKDRGVVGYVSVHWFPNLMRGSGEAYISELFVHPAATGKGIGSRLLDMVNEQAHNRGCTRLMLMNRYERESYQRGFYPKRGWVERQDAALFMLTFPEE